jgi:O-antigen/teichoic acid export membrane protein
MWLSQRLFQNTSVKQTIIKNSFWLLVSEIVSKICTFLVTLWIARYLGVESYGMSNFSMTFAGFFVLAVDFGLVNLTFRELSKHIEDRDVFFANAMIIKIMLSLVALIVAFVVTKCIGKPGIYSVLIMMYLLYAILNNLCEYLRVYFRPYERMQHEALLKVANALVFLMSSIVFILLYGTLQSVFLGFLVA